MLLLQFFKLGEWIEACFALYAGCLGIALLPSVAHPISWGYDLIKNKIIFSLLSTFIFFCFVFLNSREHRSSTPLVKIFLFFFHFLFLFFFYFLFLSFFTSFFFSFFTLFFFSFFTSFFFSRCLSWQYIAHVLRQHISQDRKTGIYSFFTLIFLL